MSARISPIVIDIKQWSRLCPSLRVIDAPDNSCLYRQGDDCSDAYIIARGHIKLTRVSASGTANTMAILPAGDLCGASFAAAAQPQAADTATAKGASRLYRVPVSQLMDALYSDTGVSAFVVDRLAKRQAFLEGRIEQLLGGDVRTRVVSILSDLSGSYGGRCAHGHEIDIRLTQQELAEMAGASRPTVSTVLNRLRDMGVVSYTRQYICIESLEALAQISADNLSDRQEPAP